MKKETVSSVTTHSLLVADLNTTDIRSEDAPNRSNAIAMIGGQVATGAFGAPIYMRSDSELHTPDGAGDPSSQFIYSAPAIPDGQQRPPPPAKTENGTTSGSARTVEYQKERVQKQPPQKPRTRPNSSSSAKAPLLTHDRRRNSSLASNGSAAPPQRKQSLVGEEYGRNRSELEIEKQHKRIRMQYRSQKQPSRQRRLTDIDFEGILNIIGGCNMWQIIIYLMISAQQVPHAMFNLSVVYMMYQPDHWCKIPGFSKDYIDNSGKVGAGWDWDKALTSGIAFPYVPNRQRGNKPWHEQCHYYDLYENTYKEYVAMNYTLAEAVGIVSRHFKNITLKRCKEWDYDTDVMRDTVVTRWDRVCDDNWSRAHVHLSYSLGYLLGCTLGGYVSDRYGRKTAIYLFGILSSIFGFLLPFTREFEVFLIVRFLGAVCNEAADLAAYVMCMEITGVKYRSIVGSLLQAPWACGYAFLALVAYVSKSWTTIQLISAFLHTAAMVLIHFLPESPRWLIVTNRVKEAEDVIRVACNLNDSRLPEDLELVRHAEERKWIKQNERPHYLHLFKSAEMTFRTLIIFIIWIATALVYYGLVIALSDQSSPGRSMFVGNFFLNNAIAGAIELPTLMGCVYLLTFGRKRSQMITLVGAGILISIGLYASIMEYSTFALIFMLAGKVCIQGAFNILYIFTSELYPTVIRNSAVGTSSMVARLGAGASGYIAILSDVTLPIVPMIIFAMFSLVAGFLVFFLPETRDLPLPDTIWDAVTMLRTDKKYKSANFTNGTDASVKLSTEDEDKPKMAPRGPIAAFPR